MLLLLTGGNKMVSFFVVIHKQIDCDIIWSTLIFSWSDSLKLLTLLILSTTLIFATLDCLTIQILVH